MQKIIEYLKSLGMDANTAATALITISVFALGLFFTWLGRQFVSWKEKTSYKKSLLLIIKDFSKACEKQVKVVNTSLDKAGLKDGNDFIIKYVPIGTLDYLNRLDFNLFLKHFEPTFFKRSYSKAISKLFELIAQLKNQNDTIGVSIKTFMEAFKQHEKQYNENMVALKKIHDSLAVQLEGKQKDSSPTSEFIQAFFNVFGYFMTAEVKLDMHSTHKNVITQILALNNKYNIPISIQVADHALQCDIAFMNVEKIDRLLFQEFKQFVHFHKRASKLTNVIIKIIR